MHKNLHIGKDCRIKESLLKQRYFNNSFAKHKGKIYIVINGERMTHLKTKRRVLKMRINTENTGLETKDITYSLHRYRVVYKVLKQDFIKRQHL